MSSVNAFVAWLGSSALLILAALVFGSFMLRLFGAATMLVPTVFLFSEANQNTADAGSYLVFVPMALTGVVMWVTGTVSTAPSTAGGNRLSHDASGACRAPNGAELPAVAPGPALSGLTA